MPNYFTTTAASAATVGADLFNGEVWARAPQDRILDAFGMAGSAAILDSEVELSIDEVRVGNFTNTALLAPQTNRDMKSLGFLGVPGGSQLRCTVRDAAATSVLNTSIRIEDA